MNNRREVIFTTYAEDTDITFIMKDVYVEEDIISTECLGWYHGTPDDNLTTRHIGSLKATYRFA